MIRKLTQADDTDVQALIMTNPAENLFLIGDIEAFGYSQSFQEVWGDFTQDGQLRAILLRYEENYIPFALTDFDASGFAEVLNRDQNKPMLSGLKEITSKIIPHLKTDFTSTRELFYAKCTTTWNLPYTGLEKVKLLTIDDIDRWVAFINGIPEFADEAAANAASKKRSIEQKVGRSYYLEQDGKMVSSASTTAENSKSAMVVAVATDNRYKGKGYATLCLAKLILDLVQEGKELCLFYDNPSAGSIYKKLGFQDIGTWMMYRH